MSRIAQYERRDRRREQVAELFLQGLMEDEIAARVGVNRTTVWRDLDAMRRDGLDDLRRAAPRRAAGVSKGKTEAFRIRNGRDERDAGSMRRRVVAALSEIQGICRGLEDVDFGKAVAAMTDQETQSFARQAGRLSGMLRQTKNHLEEASRNGEHSDEHQEQQ